MNFARRPLLQSVTRLRTLGCYARPRPILCVVNSNNSANDLKFARITSRFLNTKEENPHKKGRFQEIDDHGFQIPIEDSTRYTDEEKARRKKMGQYYSMLIAALVGLISSSYLLYIRMVNVEAKALEDGSQETLRDQEREEQQATQVNTKATEKVALHKSKAGFRERKIIEYENRIRAYSTPDKVFRYFATLQDAETSTIYMKPEDFVRSLTPDTMQPEGLGLDQFHKFDRKSKKLKYKSKLFGDESVFKCFGEGGLISFSDYVFLLTVLGTPERHVDIAFRMFDLNGDGEVSLEEFKRVKNVFLSMTTTGARHRDRSTTGNVLVEESHSGIMAYFFGENGKGKLTVDAFVNFKRKLQRQVMRLEFESYNPQNNCIKEVEFAEILMTYASLSDKQRKKKIKKVKKTFRPAESEGILFSDYLDFFSFLINIRDVDMALSFHTVAGQAVDPETFKQVAQTVAGVNLRDHLVDVVFKLFDENDDGHLSNKEFVAVMKDKLFRGLNKPKDTGLTRFLSSILICAKQHIPDYWTSPPK
ncbi:calcium uptake protein 1, mitochondrial-like [Rhopilema esculentum]|uniref:calcium uptake protein 1, mitochondrial-like n=1 Tax=Rhopilema esculentum TaxID=499914 RepID=UPI0031DA5830|eukprot:gene12895-3648_t